MTTPLPIQDLDTFVSTRDGLHRVAEHVVAKARYVDDREIRLTAFAGGFATPVLSWGTRVRIDADELVVDDAEGSRRVKLNTIGEAAALVGVEPGFPNELYPAATSFDADEPLQLDRGSAQVLAAWYSFTAEVLELFASEIRAAHPSQLILWPEHFDQAFFTEDADETRRANYGASPGDDGHPEPYMYVGPWATPAPSGFWNATHFNGAVLPLSQIVADPQPATTALQFLRAGRLLLAPVSAR